MTGITNENESRNITPYRDRQKLSRESTPQTDSSPRPSLQTKHVNASSTDMTLCDPKKHIVATPDFKSSSVKSHSSMSPLSSPLRERFSINIYPEFETDRQSRSTDPAVKKPTRPDMVKSSSSTASEPEEEEAKESPTVLFAKLAAEKNKMKEMQHQLRRARAERLRMQAELELLKKQLSEKRDELDALAINIGDQNEEKVKERLAAIQDEIDENRTILEEAEALKRDGQEELEEQENEITRLMNEIPEKMLEADDLRALLAK
ncbi:hypothetical protein BX666DRAFT_2024541 [Dichotomocladium elegans]|nr:hypothetical protein BX666DRAFT_2024541 [Dichotomocladium elegans]